MMTNSIDSRILDSIETVLNIYIFECYNYEVDSFTFYKVNFIFLIEIDLRYIVSTKYFIIMTITIVKRNSLFQ